MTKLVFTVVIQVLLMIISTLLAPIFLQYYQQKTGIINIPVQILFTFICAGNIVWIVYNIHLIINSKKL